MEGAVQGRIAPELRSSAARPRWETLLTVPNRPGDDQLVVRGRQHHAVDLQVGGRRPSEQGAARVERDEVLAGDPCARADQAAHVDRGVRGLDRVDVRPADGRPERRRQRAGGDVERGDVESGLAADRGEAAADVDARPVGRGLDDLHLSVDLRGERRDHAGRQVVREDVAARHEVRSRCGARGPGVREAAAGEHRVADDLLRPHDAGVDLHGGQRISGDRVAVPLLDRRRAVLGGRRRARASDQQSRRHDRLRS